MPVHRFVFMLCVRTYLYRCVQMSYTGYVYQFVAPCYALYEPYYGVCIGCAEISVLGHQGLCIYSIFCVAVRPLFWCQFHYVWCHISTGSQTVWFNLLLVFRTVQDHGI